MNGFDKFKLINFLNLGLFELKFIKPTFVQEKVIPLLLKNKSIICKAHTGTGKTLAFCLPILNNLNYKKTNIQCIIVTPTRELAKQIYDNILFFKKFKLTLKVNCFIGGENIKRQIEELKRKKPQIIVGTPARLKKLFEEHSLELKKLNTFIIDECDMLFDLDFIESIDFILSKINHNVCVSAFSASISNKLENFLSKYLKKSYYLNLNYNELTNKNISHILIPTKHEELSLVLLNFLKTFVPYLCLIFVNKKEEINKYYRLMIENNYSVIELHAGLKPRLRKQVIKRIKNLEYKYIIASDIAARGIDFIGITHVISMNLPNNLEYYIHRSGRTGRTNYIGYSFVFYDTKNLNLVYKLIAKGIIFKIKKLNKQGKIIEIVFGDNKYKKQIFKLINKKSNRTISFDKKKYNNKKNKHFYNKR